MSMSLGGKRELFARLISKLLQEIHRLGYEVMIEEGRRGRIQAAWNAEHCRRCQLTPEEHPEGGHVFRAIGLRDSLHEVGLAQDFTLRRNGVPLKETSSYREIGEFWEGLHPLARWGGRFDDGGHFSLEHRGKQ